MIFEDIYKDNRIQLNSFIENAIDYDNRFMLFVSIYDESTDTIIITDDIIFNEAGSKNILSKDIGLNTKKQRGILIAYSGNASHSGRMKISAPGKSVNINDSNISIYYDNGDIVLDKKCKLSDISMSGKEFKAYKDLYMRNKELINLANDKNNNIEDINNAFKNDELLRNNNKIVKRDENGNAIIYDNKGNLEKHINLKGEII
jgi:hypothetical protein